MANNSPGVAPEAWPELPLAAWQDTRDTLHMWTQIAGKIRLARMPWINHSWHVPLYITTRGLTTSAIPDGSRTFQIDFDFLTHELVIGTSDGATAKVMLEPRSVADFFGEVMGRLHDLGIEVRIWTTPVEVETPIPFQEDFEHASYDAAQARRFWQILLQSDRVLTKFRSRFIGKVSPVHFFWGSFDLAVSRFSGRTAPPHPGGIPHLADWVTREAYSHEVSSAGWWPGTAGVLAEPAYYSYAYPEPDGFRARAVQPGSAFYLEQMGEFVLPYDAVREADDPDAMLMQFLESSYAAAADAADWDRAALERQTDVKDS